MRRRSFRPVLLAGVAALAVAGCGEDVGAQDADDGAGPIAMGTVPEAYLPPPAQATVPEGEVTDVKPATTTAKAEAAADASAAASSEAAESREAQGAPTDAEVAAELKEAFKSSDGKGGSEDTASVTGQGLATVPFTAPEKVRAMISAANQVARKPYVYGGGHGADKGEGIWVDSAYDCSGSVSFALAAAGFIKTPMASGPLETFGKPGPGKWVTIYANAGHAWMTIAGLRFDTSGRSERDTRWQTANRTTAGFVVRHPPGL